MIEHSVTVKDVPRAEAPPLQDVRDPQVVVLPHLFVGERVDGIPQRYRFLRFRGRARERRRTENMRVQRVPVDELESVFTHQFKAVWGDQQFLLNLPNSTLFDRLIWLHATAWCVDLARAEPSLLSDEEHAAGLDDID